MSENLTKADLLKHESDWKDRLNKAKEQIFETIQTDRHDSKNRDTSLAFDISENKENIALHQQSQKFMEEKVSKIEEHVEDIKHLIEKQADNFVTKKELDKTNIDVSWVKDDYKKTLIAVISWLMGIVYLIIDKYL